MSSHYLILYLDAIGSDGSVVIDGQDARHLSKVLRLRAGDYISVSDGESKLYDVEIKVVGEKRVVGAIVKATSFKIPEKKLTVLQGLPKGQKMDLVIEKLTELGVARIVPVIMARSVPDYGSDKKTKRLDRWRTIAREASKQSKRLWLPEVSQIATWDEAVKKLEEYDLLLAPYEGQHEKSLGDIFDSRGKAVAAFIGPEGGFEETEIKTLQEHGAITFSLGENILRTETASIVTAALILDRMND